MQPCVRGCRHDGLRKTALMFCKFYKNELSGRMIHIILYIDENTRKMLQ